MHKIWNTHYYYSSIIAIFCSIPFFLFFNYALVQNGRNGACKLSDLVAYDEMEGNYCINHVLNAAMELLTNHHSPPKPDIVLNENKSVHDHIIVATVEKQIIMSKFG